MASEAQPGYLVQSDDFERMQRVGNALVRSGYFNTELTGQDDMGMIAQATVKVLTGHELGIGTIASMMGVHMIKGKIGLSAHLQLACAKRAGYHYTVEETGEGEQRCCRMEWTDSDGRALGSSSFSMADATRAGLNGGSSWTKYPGDMLFARAASRGVRRFCAEATAGMVVHTPEELGASVDASGEPVSVYEGGLREKQSEIAARNLKERIANLEAEGKEVPKAAREALAEHVAKSGPPAVKEPGAKSKPAPLEVVEGDAIKPIVDEKTGDPLPMNSKFVMRYTLDRAMLLKVDLLFVGRRADKTVTFTDWLGVEGYTCDGPSLAKLMRDAEAFQGEK